MNLLVILTIFLLARTLKSDDSEEYEHATLSAQLQLIDMDLEDECEDISRSVQNYLTNRSNALKEKISIAEGHGAYLRRHSAELKQVFTEGNFPYDLTRNLTVLVKPGDPLLSESEYSELVTFHNSIGDLTDKVELFNGLQKQDVADILATSRNVTELEGTWSDWQDVFATSERNFSEILKLANKAATANDGYNAKQYWEMLVEYEEGYEKAKELWDEIEPIYKKLYDFVLLKLNKFHRTNFTEIPVYLLGSNFGEDWTNLADIVLPRPQFLYDVNIELEGKNKKEVFKLAEGVTRGMGLGRLGKQFWTRSVFDGSKCDAQVLSFCAHKYSEIYTCNKTSYLHYLEAHEAALQVVLNNQDYASISRQKLRYSPLDDALVSLGSILAVGNLPKNGILEPDVFQYEETNTTNTITALLLTALRVLPRLPYYLAADFSRVDELEAPSDNFTAYWWEMRRKYQGVTSPTGLEVDYLGDPYITSNKPYLSKFFATILQFQILNYYQISLYTQDAILLDAFKEDSSFKFMLRERPVKSAMELLNFYYGVDTISVYDMKNYFEPLMEYLDHAPVDQEPIVKHGRRTTTTTSTTTTTTTTTKKPAVKDQPDGIVESDKKTNIKNEATQTVVQKSNVEADASNSTSTTKANSYIFIGVASGIIVLTILYGVSQKCRKKIRSNNRRFEA